VAPCGFVNLPLCFLFSALGQNCHVSKARTPECLGYFGVTLSAAIFVTLDCQKVHTASMAANYWASTQRMHWQFTREALSEIRESLEEDDRSLVQQYALPERRLLSIFFKDRVFGVDSQR